LRAAGGRFGLPADPDFFFVPPDFFLPRESFDVFVVDRSGFTGSETSSLISYLDLRFRLDAL